MSKFTITIRCKYYIKVYLENNCGNPVDLSLMPDIYYRFRDSLTRQEETNIQRKLEDNRIHPETVTIIIPNDWFYRYGFFIHIEERRQLLFYIEMKLKLIMRQYIEFQHIIGLTIAESIRQFQEEYCMPEPVWPYESIKKDYDRHANKLKDKRLRCVSKEFKQEMKQSLAELVDEKYFKTGYARS